MLLSPERLIELHDQGWRLTRDGSTATAHFVWEDPQEPEDGWELLVLHTSGHSPRLTLNPFEAGLTERSLPEARELASALEFALELMAGWRGELPPAAQE